MKCRVRYMPDINLFWGSLFAVYLQLNTVQQLRLSEGNKQDSPARIRLAGLSRWDRWAGGLAVRRSCHSAPECTLRSSSKPEREERTQSQIHFSWTADRWCNSNRACTCFFLNNLNRSLWYLHETQVKFSFPVCHIVLFVFSSCKLCWASFRGDEQLNKSCPHSSKSHQTLNCRGCNPVCAWIHAAMRSHTNSETLALHGDFQPLR